MFWNAGISWGVEEGQNLVGALPESALALSICYDCESEHHRY